MRYLAFVTALALGACSSSDPIDSTFNAQAKADQQAAKERAADSGALKAGFAPDQPAPLATVSLDPAPTRQPGTSLPPADAEYRYLGRWAPSAAACEHGAWTFQSRKLDAPDKRSCDLPDVSVTPGGYKLSGTCKGAPKGNVQTLDVGFDERRKMMRVSGATLGTVELVYCGN